MRAGVPAQPGTTETGAAQDLGKKPFLCQRPVQPRERELLPWLNELEQVTSLPVPWCLQLQSEIDLGLHNSVVRIT